MKKIVIMAAALTMTMALGINTFAAEKNWNDCKGGYGSVTGQGITCVRCGESDIYHGGHHTQTHQCRTRSHGAGHHGKHHGCR